MEEANNLNQPTRKEGVITIRVDPNLKAKLKKLARKDSRTLGDFIRLQLTKLVEQSEAP